jgi:tRNA-dihydrouridine synthase
MGRENQSNLYLAPMAELSHRALREIICGFFTENNRQNPENLPVFFTEMISAGGLLSGGPFEKWYLDNGPCPDRLVYQLLGADTEQLVQAAALLDERECLGIDINMGCSAPAITRTGAGVCWMKDAEKAARLIEKIRKVTKKRLSAKIRLGYPSALGLLGQKDTILPFLLGFCRGLENAGLDLITLHPRLSNEKFKRKARWEYVYALRGELGIPVVGNGDISSAEELAQKAAEGPVMAGRLAVRQPWVFAEAAGQSAGRQNVDIKATGLRFLELLAQYQPPEFRLSRARRFFHYFCDNLTWAEHLRNQINRQTSLEGIGQVWRDHSAG